MCVGRRFATLEVYLLAIKMMQRYRLEHHHNKAVEMVNQFVNVPDGPLRFRLVPR